MPYKSTAAASAQTQSESFPDITAQQLNELLRGVSRSFYLTLRVLPASIRRQIGLAYLLARAADTLADSTILPPQQRLAALQLFQQQLGGAINAVALAEIDAQLLGKLKNLDEALLLQQLPQIFALLEQQSTADRGRIENVVTTLTGGMIYDLTTFPLEESGEVRALQRWEDLDDYTYRVAGCVGEFWTEISIAHLPPLRRWDRQHYAQLGICFGKGLQLTNILRDLPRDLRLGRCYLPQQWLQPYGLSVAMLQDAANNAAAQPLLHAGIEQARSHFAAATEYVTAIPRRCIRLRLAALWPLLIGLATLSKLAATTQWLDVNQVVKVERRWVYRMMLLSLFAVASNTLIRRWAGRLEGRVSR